MMETLAGQFETYLPPAEIALRTISALVLGTLIGLERELRQKPAGLRTCMLVALTSAAFVVGSIELSMRLADDGPDFNLDPLRAIEAIVTGIAFLGAGAILQSGGHVRGLTTGASIWLTGAIGLIAGAGQVLFALFVALLGLFVLHLMGRIEHRWVKTKDGEEQSSSK